MSSFSLRIVVALGILGGSAQAEEHASLAHEFVDALISGTPKLAIRLRYEHADFDVSGADESDAVTVRTRLGYGSAPFYGLSGYVEMENIASPNSGDYFDGVETSTAGQVPIADPEATEVNQAFGLLAFETVAGFDAKLKAGRQRIVYDDARFIGNVGWRQNEQTYDAYGGSTNLLLDGLQLSYVYVNDVQRIFGGQGSGIDFRSDSHLVRVSYDALPWARVTSFAYLLDFSNAAANSSRSFGFRMTGSYDIDERFSVSYVGSYARQNDAGDNPNDYGADFYNAEAGLAFGPIGKLSVGYEVLGSDGGNAQFRTPLATAHKFNGWADVFLDNGGSVGLRDLYVSFAPSLPWGLQGSFVYHHFAPDSGSSDYGDEFDFVLKRRFWKHLLVLVKFGYYDGSSSVRASRHRTSLEANLSF